MAMEGDSAMAMSGGIPVSVRKDITVAMVGSHGVDTSDHPGVAALTRRVPVLWGHPG